MKKTLTVKLIRSLIGRPQNVRATIKGLGLRRINHSVKLEENPCVLGMINKVSYMLEVS